MIPYKAEVYRKILCNGWSFTNTGREDVSPVFGDLSSLELQLCPDNCMSQSHFKSLNSTEHTSSLSEVMFFQVPFSTNDMFHR